MSPRIRKVSAGLGSILITIIIFTVAGIIIAYGRGYRIDITQKSLNPTGLLVATSDPTGAQILVNGEVKSATNTTLGLPPDWYSVQIIKEGFQPYQKNLRVQGEVVSRADAYLFPNTPSLSALTTTGALSPALSPDGGKLAYIVTNHATEPRLPNLPDRTGIWILDITDKPLGLNRDARQILRGQSLRWPIEQTNIHWSPDSKQILLRQKVSNSIGAYLLDSDRLNPSPTYLSQTITLDKQWQALQQLKDQEKLAGLPLELVNIATSSMSIVNFSPDERKILYVATAAATISEIITPPLIGTNPSEQTRILTPGQLYVYDIKEDRNYILSDIPKWPPPVLTPTPTKKSLPKPTAVSNEQTTRPPANYPYPQWLPTSRHLLLVSADKISVMEYDGTNRQTIYAGPFFDSFVIPWSNTSKLVILTTLNPGATLPPNLYTINLR